MPQEVTREDLFTQVWERPKTQVSADYGISDVAMEKICDKHRIPVPGRGYWAKKEAGKPFNLLAPNARVSLCPWKEPPGRPSPRCFMSVTSWQRMPHDAHAV